MLYEISTDKARLQLNVIHGFLSTSYWARNIPRDTVERAIKNSLCFGAYHEDTQVAFARVISDYATFAYLADVFVIPEHRGHGVAKLLLKTILRREELQGLRRFLLATRDAHALYGQYGFKPFEHPEYLMSIHRPDCYS